MLRVIVVNGTRMCICEPEELVEVIVSLIMTNRYIPDEDFLEIMTAQEWNQREESKVKPRMRI